MLMRTDPFRAIDRLTQQLWCTATRPIVMAMDAWRDGDEFVPPTVRCPLRVHRSRTVSGCLRKVCRCLFGAMGAESSWCV